MENENTAKATTKEPTRWQRLRFRFMRWWLFNFRNKTLWRGEIGGFKYRFRKYWLDIRSTAPNHWNMRIGIANHAYGFLLAVLNDMQNVTDEDERKRLENHFTFFTTNLYYTSAYLFADVKFAKGLKKELDWAYSRMMKKAAEEAKSVTKEQEDADQVFMEDAVKRGNMNRAERRRASREEKKAMKEILEKEKSKMPPVSKGISKSKKG